jgi:hypothetical protein
MAHFIRDIRKELNAPKMPFVIGVMGIGGPDVGEGKNLGLRKSQLATAQLPEFKGNVAAVETGPFWDTEVEQAEGKVRQADSLLEKSEHWTVIGKPEPKDRIWNYTSFTIEEEEQYEKTSQYDRDFTSKTPEGMEDWLKADFDTSKWQKGPAPIGKGIAPKSKGQDTLADLIRSPWGEGNMLLMKTTFDLDRSDIEHVRLCLRSSGSFRAYVNGNLAKDYPWWSGAHAIRTFDCEREFVKQGVNELALYGNIAEHKGAFFNAVDLYLEGMPKDKADEIKRQQDEIAPPRIRALAKGKSNQDYHYLGSAYTYSQIGEAMARGILDMQKE